MFAGITAVQEGAEGSLEVCTPGNHSGGGKLTGKHIVKSYENSWRPINMQQPLFRKAKS